VDSTTNFTVELDPAVWWAAHQQARLHGSEPRHWINQQIAAICAQRRSARSESPLFDLARRHLERLGLSKTEKRVFADAVRSAVVHGRQQVVGPLAETGRRYGIERLEDSVVITVGIGRMQLPVVDALSLADSLSPRANNLVMLRPKNAGNQAALRGAYEE
jgi:hypothetical protein